MELVESDQAQQAVLAGRFSTELPGYAIFVYLAKFDRVAILSRNLTHGHCLALIRNCVINAGQKVEFSNDDVYDGSIEWEDENSFAIRTHSAIPRLTPEMSRELMQIVIQLSQGNVQ